MHPIDILVAEHSLIRQYLSSLSFALEKLERGENLAREYVEQIVLFARNFVDKHHHFKEEYQMFVLVLGGLAGLCLALALATKDMPEG